MSLTVHRGQTVAVVGETGSGKSTLGRLIVRLEPPSSGDVIVDGRSVLGLRGEDAQRMRRKVQIILQDPYSTLNPYRSVADSIGEVLRVHGMRGASSATPRPTACSAWSVSRSPCVTGCPVSCQVAAGSASASPGRSRWARS